MGLENLNPTALDRINLYIQATLFEDYGISLSVILTACLDMDFVKKRVLVQGKAGLKNLAGKTLSQMQR